MSDVGIGILTYHRADNDGSILQALCLSILARKISSLPVRIIDYFPVPSDRIDLNWIKSIKNAALQVRQPRLSYLRENSALTSPLMVMNRGALEKLTRQENINHIVCGSDTVWDSRNREWSRTSFKPTFTNLSSLRQSFHHSYFAASADPTFKLREEPEAALEFRTAIEMSKFCGFRDTPTQEMALSAGVSPELLHFTPDPTLWEWPEDLTPAEADRQTIVMDGPIGLQMTNPRVKTALKAALAERGIPYVDLASEPTVHPKSGGASAFRAAMFWRQELRGLITDRFHGAIIFEHLNRYVSKPVVLIEDADKWKDRPGKLTDMYIRMGARNLVKAVSSTPSPETIDEIVHMIAGGNDIMKTDDLYKAMTDLREQNRAVLDRFALALTTN